MLKRLGEWIGKLIGGAGAAPAAPARKSAPVVPARKSTPAVRTAPVQKKKMPPPASRQEKAKEKPTIPVPKQSIDPRRFAGLKGAGAWTLMVPNTEQACDFARENAGKRFPAATAIPIPGPGCGRTDCVCIYKVETDSRKNARREKSERRDEVRFETKKIDRRKKSSRRVEDARDRKRT